MLKLLISTILLSAGIAQAQVNKDPTNRLQRLERKVQQMEARLRALEYNQSPYPPSENTPVPSISYSAILVDSGYSKTFLGQGNSRLEAEAVARQECAKVLHSSYCNSPVRIAQTDPRSRGAFCLVVDSGYSKTFSGRGADVIEAEAKAKQACQADIHGSYCGNVKARCESEL